ncbi:MAG: hypothetical protein ABW321_16475 [Polyangiales bacterium]
MLLTLFVSAPARVHAGNDDELLVGNRAAMLGGAVIATVNDSSATWYNPAGLGAIDRDQFDVSATVYTLRTHSVPKLLATPSGAYDNGSVTEFVVAPTQVAYVRRLAQNVALGFGYFVPKASSFVMRENLNDRNGTPPSQWQLAAAGSETEHVGALGLGVGITPRLRVGGSLLGTYTSTTASAALFGAVSPNGDTLASSAITSVATYSRLSVQIGLGAQWQVSDVFTLGVNVRTPEVQLYYSENNNYNISVTSLVDEPRFGAMATEEIISGSFELLRMGRAGVSASYAYAAGTITAEVDFQPGLHREKVDVNRQAVVNARLGWFHSVSPSVAFGLGLFTDRRTDAERYSLIDGGGDFYGATLGIQLDNEHQLAPGERASSLVFNSVFALRYAYGAGDFGRILADPTLVAENPFLIDKGRIHEHELGLYVGGGRRV